MLGPQPLIFRSRLRFHHSLQVAERGRTFLLLILVAALSYFEAVLTLPGIAGVILTIGMAVDSNVLIYAASGTEKELTKRETALTLIRAANFATSAQVLQEFYVNMVRKIKVPFSEQEALDWIEQITKFPCQPIDQGIVRAAIEIATRFRISYWDGAILAAAESLGCTTVYSEDLNDGQLYGTVRVINPFRTH